jgi:hypothetical protein
MLLDNSLFAVGFCRLAGLPSTPERGRSAKLRGLCHFRLGTLIRKRLCRSSATVGIGKDKGGWRNRRFCHRAGVPESGGKQRKFGGQWRGGAALNSLNLRQKRERKNGPFQPNLGRKPHFEILCTANTVL